MSYGEDPRGHSGATPSVPVSNNGLTWRKAVASGSGNCLEVAFRGDGAVFIRNSRDPQGNVLTFTGSEWDCFLDGATKGEFKRASHR
jgi:hypothetical protein